MQKWQLRPRSMKRVQRSKGRSLSLLFCPPFSLQQPSPLLSQKKIFRLVSAPLSYGSKTWTSSPRELMSKWLLPCKPITKQTFHLYSMWAHGRGHGFHAWPMSKQPTFSTPCELADVDMAFTHDQCQNHQTSIFPRQMNGTKLPSSPVRWMGQKVFFLLKWLCFRSF